MMLYSYHNTCGNIWKITGQFTQVNCSDSATAPAISPAQDTLSAPAISSALSSFPHRQDFPRKWYFPRLDPASSGIPRSVLPDSGTHPARLPQVSLATPERPYVRLPRKGGYPHTKWELSLGSSGDISIYHSGVSRGHRNAPQMS